MSIIATFLNNYDFYRTRTLALLDKIAAEPSSQAVLSWRPAPGRAHIAWQFMHVGMTEEIFATERLAPHKRGQFTELWPRFRGGSTPDDEIPSVDQIRRVLAESRRALIDTLNEYTEDRLGEIPPALAERKLAVRDVLYLIGWHEAHHQGQAHITFNLYKAAHPTNR
jgi:uncharacterized damage-inducible protein DinB